jgi:hypothetical protein
MHRKLGHVALKADAVKKYIPVQQQIAHLLLEAFLDTPRDFISHVRL